ncbi:hypothetical protein Drose_28235 [Dactylosporangium roseum]|uniref:HAD family phosphatase n=1 Tax=Dactylosporangium roseum TaxID=47989 RepID=A0ABY5Z2P4_9ACTN|nr:hypothetical protein [Dactylosporangium roseum]UWZ35028.1 hypothetical protein Drose_28235 [Dactylosporangium roseum]
MATPKGLLVDYGGVLTTDVFVSFDAFRAREGLKPARALGMTTLHRQDTRTTIGTLRTRL